MTTPFTNIPKNSLSAIKSELEKSWRTKKFFSYHNNRENEKSLSGIIRMLSHEEAFW